MKAILQINYIWSIFLAVIFGYYFIASIALDGFSFFSTAQFVIILLYVIACRQARKLKPWALKGVLVMSVIISVRYLSMVLINIFMFITGHELYRDSPATIFVVLMNATLFAIPATIFSLYYLRNIKKMLNNQASNKPW